MTVQTVSLNNNDTQPSAAPGESTIRLTQLKADLLESAVEPSMPSTNREAFQQAFTPSDNPAPDSKVEWKFAEQVLPAQWFDFMGSGINVLQEGEDYVFKEVANIGSSLQEAFNNNNVTPTFNFSDIDNSYGSLFKTTPTGNTSTEPPAKRPLPTSQPELVKNVVDAIVQQEGYFHAVTNDVNSKEDVRGRAYAKNINNALSYLKKEPLDLNDPEVKKMVVAIARQLYSEAALEPNLIPFFHEVLQMKEFGRQITEEQLNQIIGSLSEKQLATLHDGVVVSLQERLKTAPKGWIMEKQGTINTEELEDLRGKKDVGLERVWRTVSKVWSKEEIVQAETNFKRQTGYNTEFGEKFIANGGNIDQAISDIVKRQAETCASGKINEQPQESQQSAELQFRPKSYLFGSQSEVLEAGADLYRIHEEEREESSPFYSGIGKLISPFAMSALELALSRAGNPDMVVDPKFRKYISTSEIEQGNITGGGTTLSSIVPVDKEFSGIV